MTFKDYKQTQKEVEDLLNNGGITKRLYDKAEKEQNEGLINRISILAFLYKCNRISALELLVRFALLYVDGTDYKSKDSDIVKEFFGE